MTSPNISLPRKRYREGRNPPADRSTRSPPLTAMGYLSVDETVVQPAVTSTGRLSITIPMHSKFAVGCLAVGVGREGGAVVEALASASWFAHLRKAASAPLYGAGPSTMTMLHDVIEGVRGPHVVSVALPTCPGQADVEAACAVVHKLRPRGAFLVATVSEPSPVAMAGLGEAFDCLVEGDGSLHHHWYPTRTVVEPRSGRPICYDLYDICCLWAGRVGTFGVVIPTADALHVEVSSEVASLAEVDHLAAGMAAGLVGPGRLQLFNVVDGAGSRATAISFSDCGFVRQDRAVATRSHFLQDAG